MPIITKYSLKQYNKAIELKEKGYGSQRIAKILGLSRRGAVEDWINKGRKPYYFSEKRITACNSQENIERMRKMNKITQPRAVKISAELRTKRLPESAKKLSKDLGYVLGVAYSDGHVNTIQRKVILRVTDKDFALEFKKILERWSGFKAKFATWVPKPKLHILSKKRIYLVYIDSKEASEFLRSFDITILKRSKKDVKCTFLRGMFDSDGYAAKGINWLACFSIRYSLITLIKDLLTSLSIDSTLTVTKTKPIGPYGGGKPYYRLNIYKMKSIINFYDLIGFTLLRRQQRLIDQVDNMI